MAAITATGFPDSHITATTTVTSTTTKVSTNLRFDQSYIRTIPGILKIAQVVISLLGFICVELGGCYYCSQKNWYGFVSMTAFWATLVLLGFYLFHVIEKLHKIPWLLGEFGYCAIWTLLYLIASLVVSVSGGAESSWAAGGFFGFVAMVLYGIDAFLKFRAWRNGDIAQGERTVATTTSKTTSPTSPNYPAY